MAALEPSQQPNGYKGALAKLAAAPFGDAMLALLTLGPAAFVLWQVVLRGEGATRGRVYSVETGAALDNRRTRRRGSLADKAGVLCSSQPSCPCSSRSGRP
jgi:hypothetical protein